MGFGCCPCCPVNAAFPRVHIGPPSPHCGVHRTVRFRIHHGWVDRKGSANLDEDCGHNVVGLYSFHGRPARGPGIRLSAAPFSMNQPCPLGPPPDAPGTKPAMLGSSFATSLQRVGLVANPTAPVPAGLLFRPCSHSLATHSTPPMRGAGITREAWLHNHILQYRLDCVAVLAERVGPSLSAALSSRAQAGCMPAHSPPCLFSDAGNTSR